MTGRLILAATPIGNVDDASCRLKKALSTAGVVAAEDTRRLKDLCRKLEVTIVGEVIAVHDHNESDRAKELAAKVAAGETVLVVTDAGMPTVSDPGYRIVQEAIDAGIEITVLPGPSAVLAALALSGLPSNRFCFEGFLPRAPGDRERALATLSREVRTMIFFESPRRTASTLGVLAEAMGPDRPAAVARELTKTHEEVHRDTLGALADWAASKEILGEVTIVVAGAPVGAADPSGLVSEVEARVRDGERLKDVVQEIGPLTGIRPGDLYREVLTRRAALAAYPHR